MIIEQYLSTTFWIVLVFSGGPLLLSSVSGFIVAFLQAATQLQEQSITYTVKFLTLAGSLVIFGRWFIEEISKFLADVLLTLPNLNSVLP